MVMLSNVELMQKILNLIFAPSPGHIDFLLMPGGMGTRIDSAIYAGCDIPPFMTLC